MFGWFRKKEVYQPNMFEGVDLNDWAYLGYTKISYHDENKVETASARIMFFCAYVSDDPEDETLDIDTRMWVFSTTSCPELFKYHHYIDQLNLWRIGETPIFDCISVSSLALREYMLNTYDYVWSPEKKKWVENQSVEDAKYKDALDNQKKSSKLVTDENIVKVEFKK